MKSMFLKIDGVTGESEDSAHQGWSDIQNYTWGVNRNGPGPGNSRYRNLTVYSQLDQATSATLLLATNGNYIKSITISLCKAGNGMLEFCRITLEHVLILGVNINGSDVTYDFEGDRVKFQYWKQTVAGIKGPESRMGWDIRNTTSFF
ncbi:Hcp family type VI secretion system effector [Mixta intestinalis]|jgi:type VI secretion system secreted protein Hcp|uniref:Major exported protein n=1 Tax=Mixta intestinalis TaxID=1615494 RepID=A0A6P1PXV7_9GAMM|nr:type VI secretion system tube protein Hcp [Mixta intestinalis]QHM70638.1 hypothetical protein C7M51_00916 [Mixta intestinalis]